MKTYNEYIKGEKSHTDTLKWDSDMDLTEGFLRGASAVVIFNKIRSLSAQVKRERDVSKRLELVASQNTNLAAMVFAMTQFVSKNKKL